MKTNNTIYNKNRTKIKNTFNKMKKNYNCIFHCKINNNDCINSIDINDDKVVFGTLMGDVYLCRVDEKKLNQKNNEISKIKENNKLPISPHNKTDNIENDASNIKLNNNNSNNKCDCIKLSINKSNNDDENNEDEDNDNDNNVKIFNKKNKNVNMGIRINMNNMNNNNENHSKKNNYNNENKNYTDEENIDDEEEDENSNKYEKKLMGKIQSTKKNGNIEINKSKIESKLFNEKHMHNKNNEEKNKNKNVEINFPQITKLIIRSKENIPCLEFENHDIINISIGDLEVIRLENMSTFNINDDTSTYNYSKIRNYRTENDHIEFCENCTCMMSNSCFLIIFTQYGNFNSVLEVKEIKYENKNLKKYEIINGTILISNYVVPFDFDGDQFLFLDYISKNERTINVVYTATKKEKYNYIIKTNNYGHISHMKLLPNNKIFLCKNNNECEIHLMNKDFQQIEKWIHVGKDIISCYIYIKKNIINKHNKNNDKKNNKSLNDSNNKEEDDQENDNMESIDEEKSEVEIKTNILKLIENKINNKTKKNFVNINQTINLDTYHPNTDEVNNITIKKNKKSLVSSNCNENNINFTENNHINFNKKNIIINNIRSINPSLDNSSRRDINITMENKRNTSNRNSKTNSNTKYNLLTSDKKKKNSKNSLSSIEIYGKKKLNGIKYKLSKYGQYIGSNIGDNEEDQTIIKSKEIEKYYIFTLDKDGSVNIYHNQKQKTLFNMYNINNIDNKYKKLEFFSIGFPYYIVANELYICITTDHGLFVISKNND